ncbi:MAG: hypothetical protein JNJ63_01370 [Hyphomonadaceae bacterium]|nr:hypothetical protein [Hyphomonadaceae bacterium]
MVNSISSGLASALFGASGTSTSGVDANLLTSWAKAKAGIGVDTATATQDPNAPIAPVWTPGVSPAASVLVERALANKAFFDTSAKLYSDLGATGDYKRLFALYSGLSTLQALAGNAESATLSAAQRKQTEAAFARGLTELQAFFASEQFEDVRLAQGDRVDAAQTTLAMPTVSEDYVTNYIHRGGLYEKLAGLDPNAKFTVVAQSATGVTRNVVIDLSQMGSTTRSFGNVISFINGRLSAAGAASRLEAADITPKETSTVLAGKTVSSKYTGPKQYALKVDVRAGEKISFQPDSATPAFYVLGAAGSSTRLVKLEDVGGEGGQPVWLTRPGATDNPIGANVATGWYGPGSPYTAAPAGAWEQRTATLTSSGVNTLESALRAAGEAVLKLETPDGRTITLTTGWRTGDQEAWRGSDDQALLDDLSERLTQLMHEQGLAAGVDTWEDSGNGGLSIFAGDGIRAASLTIGGKTVSLDTIEPPGMVGGLRDGVFARRYEAGAVASSSDLFVGEQSFTITTATKTQVIKIEGGAGGITAAALETQLNAQLRDKGIPAAASLVDNAGTLTLRVDGLHNVIGVSATLNGAAHEALLQAPGAWVDGGLPIASAGQPFGDAIRTTNVTGGAPLATYTGALDIQIIVDTPTGQKTVSVAVSALERAGDPDPAPGEWSGAFQDRLNAALNAAGLYMSADGADLTQWRTAEGSGQRLSSIKINGDTLTLQSADPGAGLGGASAAQRSFTSAQAATGVSDDVAALLGNQTVSITLDTLWGQRTITASLQGGDPATLESAALRLNEALAAQGYDAGVVATALSGGGAGLRVVTGSSNTVRAIKDVNLGGSATTLTLDPIDSSSHAADPVGTLSVALRAARGASASVVIPAQSTFTAPSANASGWFPGRAFDVAIGSNLQIATARSVAAGADGSVYVLADLGGDTSASVIKGARDVALLKYDSAGKLQFSEMLGASQSASGFALAVSADGKVAVAGSVEGELSGTSSKGGADSFVSVFDANGKELWTARRGADRADQVNAIAFASNGSVIVAGQTESALGGQVALGAADGYVRGYSASGGELFTKQFGSGGADAATALLVRDNGSGGFDIFTGGVENNRGILRSFSYSTSAGFAAGASRDIGYFYNGAINAIVADGASLYVGGEVGADRLTLGAPAKASAAGKDGFVARINADLVSANLDRASYLGSSQDDAVKSLALVGGAIYAAGNAGGVIAGQGGGKSSFLTRLDANGEVAWARTFNSVAGNLSFAGMATSAAGASPLDVFGLPTGAITPQSSAPLASRSALRAGDEFRIGADGRRLTTIKIGTNDTLASLAASINRVIGAAGKAEVVKESGLERLKISARDGKALRLDAGGEGRDALGALGLGPGVIAVNSAGRGALKTYGLGLIAADLRLDSKANITRTKAELSAAVSIVRQAYDGLLNPNAKELTAEEKALQERRQNAGVAPQYYSARLANYQAALARLGGG